MKLNEFVKMHKNFTKGMKTLNEESMENFDVEKFTQDLDDADAISSGGEMTFTPEETTTRCFSQMGHKVSFNDAVTLLFDYLGQKNLANFATIANRDEDGKCDQDLVAAIQIAQEDLGVNVDGIMGRKTIGALRDATLDPEFLNNTDKDKPFTPFGDEIDKEMKPVQSVKKKEIEDSSRPSGNSQYVAFITENLDEITEACGQHLGIGFDFSPSGIKDFQKQCGFSGQNRSFKVTNTDTGKVTVFKTTGQVDGKVGPQTMTAVALVLLYSGDGAMAEAYSKEKLNGKCVFESSKFSLKDRLLNNLSEIAVNESPEEFTLEDFISSKTFKTRAVPVHNYIRIENPSVPDVLNISSRLGLNLQEKYESYKGIGISKALSSEKIKTIKLFIDVVKEYLSNDPVFSEYGNKAVIAILAVCGKESNFLPKLAESAAYRFDTIKNNGSKAVTKRIRARFLNVVKGAEQQRPGPGRMPTDEEIRAITGGRRNSAALFNIAYGYSNYNQSAPNKITTDDKLIVNGEINPKLYDPNLPGYKYRGRSMVQITFHYTYRRVEQEAMKKGITQLKGMTENPEIVIESAQNNVLAAMLYLSVSNSKAIKRMKRRDDEGEMEFLVRKLASRPMGSNISGNYYPGYSQVTAASGKLKHFILLDDKL